MSKNLSPREEEIFGRILTKFGQLEARVVTIETDCKKYDKLLTEGDTQPSILVQLALMSRDMTNMRVDLGDLKDTFAATKVPVANKWQMGVMVACTIISAVVALTVAVIGKIR